MLSLLTLERQEARQYAKGKAVALKEQPGKVYRIEEFDPMMIPPIWLENDPMPHYPHELLLISPLDDPVASPVFQAA